MWRDNTSHDAGRHVIATGDTYSEGESHSERSDAAMHHEYRAGEATFGPLQLKSIWISHLLRNFELMVILQVSGCEHTVARVLRGESISSADRGPLDIANHVAKHKGYLPLFEMSGQPQISEDGHQVLKDVLESDEWRGRDTRQLTGRSTPKSRPSCARQPHDTGTRST